MSTPRQTERIPRSISLELHAHGIEEHDVLDANALTMEVLGQFSYEKYTFHKVPSQHALSLSFSRTRRQMVAVTSVAEKLRGTRTINSWTAS